MHNLAEIPSVSRAVAEATQSESEMATVDVLRSVHDQIISPQKLPNIRSNQGKSVATASTGWLHSVPADTPAKELQARYQRDGYVWVKNVIPREDVFDMREE